MTLDEPNAKGLSYREPVVTLGQGGGHRAGLLGARASARFVLSQAGTDAWPRASAAALARGLSDSERKAVLAHLYSLR